QRRTRSKSPSRSGVNVYATVKSPYIPKAFSLVQLSRTLVVVDPLSTPVLDLAAPSATSRPWTTTLALRQEIRDRSGHNADQHDVVEQLELGRDRLACGRNEADEQESPKGLGHEGPLRGKNDACFAQAPHSASSSFLTQPLRTARRSSSRSVVSSISGPSVLNENRTLCLLNTAMYSPSSSASLTTFESRLDEGQISRRTPRSASRLHSAALRAAGIPWPIRSGSRYWSTSSTLSQSSSSPA